MELEILLEVDRICQKHDLRYYLIGGSVLGAIRHSGFIPWDDDVDLAMPRPDYERFLEVGSRELPDNYFVQTFKSQPHFPLPFAKVSRNDTTFIGALCKSSKYIMVFSSMCFLWTASQKGPCCVQSNTTC